MRFRDRLLNDPIGVLDSEKVHHEFVRGQHGRKLDFDKILTGTEFFHQWMAVYGAWIAHMYNGDLPDIIVGEADGANRIAKPLAQIVLGDSELGLLTEKDHSDNRIVRPTEEAKQKIFDLKPDYVLVVDDAGTTGSTQAQTARELFDLGVPRIEAVNTWQRSLELPELIAIGVKYRAMVHEPLPTYEPGECRMLPQGYCYQMTFDSSMVYIPRS